MKLLRLALTLGSLGLLAGGLSSCLHEPDFSKTPQISFDNIRVSRYTPANRQDQAIDTFRITVRYQDGDGDLGLNQDEQRVAPYNSGRFSKNYFIEPFIKNRVTKKFESTVVLGLTTAGAYNGVYPHPTTLTDGKPAPIKGTLTYTPIPFGLGDVFQPGQTVRFEVSITDRALNVSNTIVTDSVVIAPR